MLCPAQARCHSTPGAPAPVVQVVAGDAVEINPSVGQGFRVMSVHEWAARWKRNDDFPACLRCGGSNTKEHYFTQV